jgi:hypothetical protein
VVVGHALGVLVELDSVAGQPCQEGVGVRVVRDGMLGDQELRRRLIDAGELADDVGGRAEASPSEVERLHGRRRAPRVEDGVVVDLAHGGEGAAVDRGQTAQLVAILHPVGGKPRG